MTTEIEKLQEIMRRLRDPQKGCPWDKEQNYRSIVRHTIEEAYEVADAIEREDYAALKDELGDLLFQVIYYCQFAAEENRFTLQGVIEDLCNKMIARHPHVFSALEIRDTEALNKHWEENKARKRVEKAKLSGKEPRLLDDVPITLPGLTRAVKLQKRAARVGFDWTKTSEILAKLQEEIRELEDEINNEHKEKDKGKARIEDELGDVLFVMANLARRLNIDPETALRSANQKFERRFGYIEKTLKSQKRNLEEANLEEMESLWQEAKDKEREIAKSA